MSNYEYIKLIICLFANDFGFTKHKRKYRILKLLTVLLNGKWTWYWNLEASDHEEGNVIIPLITTTTPAF